jgi:tetratricopeptide (TPR) repeat protein
MNALPNAIIRQGVLLEEQERLAEAIDLLEHGVRRFPEHPGLRELLAKGYATGRRYKEAAGHYEILTCLLPDAPTGYTGACTCYLAAGATDKADVVLLHAMSIFADPAEKLKLFKSLLAASQAHQPTSWLLGHLRSLIATCTAQGEHALALEAANLAFPMLPDPCTTITWKAEIALLRRDPEAAIFHWDELLEIRPGNPIAMLRKACIMADMHREDVAEALIRKVLDIVPHHSDAHLLYAQLAMNSGNLAEAFRRWRSGYMKNTEKSPVFHDALGGILAKHFTMASQGVETERTECEIINILLLQPKDHLVHTRMTVLGKIYFEAIKDGTKDEIGRAVHKRSTVLKRKQLNVCAAINMLIFGFDQKDFTSEELIRVHMQNFNPDHFFCIMQSKTSKEHLYNFITSEKLRGITISELAFYYISSFPFMLDKQKSNTLSEDLTTAFNEHKELSNNITIKYFYNKTTAEGLLGSAKNTSTAYPWMSKPALGRIHYPDRPLRIAVCISGQMRGYRHAFPTWTSLKLDEHKTSYFVHTWKDIGAITKQNADRLSSFPRNVQSYSAMRWRKTYKHTTIDDLDIIDYYKCKDVRIEDDKTGVYSLFSNSMKMHYKIHACHDLALQYDEYDLIIRIRPDKELGANSEIDWHRIAYDSDRERIVFTDGDLIDFYPLAGLAIGDQFAVGGPESMNIYASTWSFTNIARQTQLPLFPHNFDGHVNITHMLLLHGIRPQKMHEINFGRLMEATELLEQKP